MSAPEATQEFSDSQGNLRLQKLKRLQESGRDPFLIERYERSHSAAELTAEDGFSASEGREVSVGGRLTSVRLMGKAAFADLRDQSGRVQIYVRRDDVGEQQFASFREMDLGDLIGVRGALFKTRAGEISIHATEVTLLAKALRPPPIGKQDESGQTHGALTEQELRYRRRYLDLIANPESRGVLIGRSVAVSAMRRFLDGKGFLEVETPVLQYVAGGAAARPFTTHHNALDTDFKLRISLELYLKRLIVGGLEKVYEIGRVFRNEGLSTRHSPEFTLMELYQAYANLEDVMELTEEMYCAVAAAVNGTPAIPSEQGPIDLSVRPWLRLPMLEGIGRYAGIRPEELESLESAKSACRRIGVPFDLDKEPTLGGLIEKLHEQYTQPNLIQPTFITDFPVEISPLAKKRTDNPGLTRRFELYINSQELGNAFSEINDPLDQRQRFERQLEQLAAGNAEAHPMDEDFLRSLEYGMPPTGGLGIGIDRMVMVITGASTIRDVILFPVMRPEV